MSKKRSGKRFFIFAILPLYFALILSFVVNTYASVTLYDYSDLNGKDLTFSSSLDTLFTNYPDLDITLYDLSGNNFLGMWSPGAEPTEMYGSLQYSSITFNANSKTVKLNNILVYSSGSWSNNTVFGETYNYLWVSFNANINLQYNTADSTDYFDNDILAFLGSAITSMSTHLRFFTLTYNANGGIGTPPSSVEFVQRGHDTYTLLGNSTNLYKNHYRFVGWNTNPNATSGLGVVMPTSDMVFYAIWEYIPNEFTIYFLGNGATGGLPPTAVIVNEGTNYNITQGANTLYKTNYTFVGWNTNPNANTGLDYILVNSDTDLYAIWAPSGTTYYSITFNGNGATGGVLPNNQSVVSGITYNLPSNTGGLFRNGYIFLGWNTNSSATTTLSSKVINSNTTFYAIWQEVEAMPTMYNVSFLGNGASGGSVPQSQSVISGTNWQVIGNVGNLVKEGYVFIGWNTNSSASVGLSSVVVNDDVVLYAIWEEVTGIALGRWYYFNDHINSATDFSLNVPFIVNGNLYHTIRYDYNQSSLYFDDLLVYQGNWLYDNFRQVYFSESKCTLNQFTWLGANGSFVYIGDTEVYTFKDLMFSVADAPIKTLSGLLSFEVFGVNLFIAICSVITLALVIWVVKKFV